jgi:diguanylate cyclase (GGDEF)-like protein
MSELASYEAPLPLEPPVSRLALFTGRPMVFVWIAGLILTMLRLFSGSLGKGQAGFEVLLQLSAAGIGAAACFSAFHMARKRWLMRVRIAWACIGASAAFCALGWGLFALTRTRGEASPADIGWVIQQPLLWGGLFLLAWRGRSLGMMRLLTDTLIVVLSAVVLSWSLVLQQRLFGDQDMSLMTKALAIYYPIFDIAHLFCALMLIANVRDRPALSRAAGWVLLGVIFLIFADSVRTYAPAARILKSAVFDLVQIWSYLFIGIAALIHARLPEGRDKVAFISNLDDAVEAAPPGVPLGASPWDQNVVRWHRSAMLWLPYIATLGVSGVLIAQEMKKANSETVQRLLPVLALLLAIVARQMITLWDNLQLAEKLRASNVDLESGIRDRTRHLENLHGITSTLNTSLDRRTVLRVTLEKTIAAVGADGGGIWLRDARRDIYTNSAPSYEWSLVHWQGLGDDAGTVSLLRDLSIAFVERENGPSAFNFSPATREAMEAGVAPPERRLIRVPVRWQGSVMGVMGLMRRDGMFSYEDRALVESVALEAGTALQNARLYTEAAHRADRDSVTELLNHRAIQENLGTTLARCKRTGNQFSIIMMDLNNFKFFNDTYGHPVGDDVLRAVARALKDSCRASDILGRYGGDEFILLLPDTDSAGTIEMCQRIEAALDARHFEPVPGTKLPIAISFGWAAFPGDGDSIHELLTQADSNLYNHKRGGASYLTQSAKAARESREEMKRLKSRAFGGSFGVLDALVTAIDNKDHYTRHHSEEVTLLSLLVGKEIGYDEEQLRAVRISGLLHDVGKIAVPDDILRHPGKLGRDEWDIMQQHPVFGALIVKDVPNLEHVLEGIRHHHEKWDGSGYPDKLAGEDIPEMGRLLAMGDCYSALTTDRPYRKGWKPEAALEEIERCRGTHFDPRLCDAFLKVMRRELQNQVEELDYGIRIAETFGDDVSAEAMEEVKAEDEANTSHAVPVLDLPVPAKV